MFVNHSDKLAQEHPRLAPKVRIHQHTRAQAEESLDKVKKYIDKGLCTPSEMAAVAAGLSEY